MWDKIKNIAINKYISQNSSKISFCFTAGCKEINFIDGPVWNCNVCHFSYCNLCRVIISLFRKFYILDILVNNPSRLNKLINILRNICLKME